MNNRSLHDNIDSLCRFMEHLGMRLNSQYVHIKADAGGISENLRDASYQNGKPVELIMCIIPNPAPSLYAAIKNHADTDIGIPTQCITLKIFERLPSSKLSANIALKINMKLGGINHVLDSADVSFINEKPTIIFGADMNYPTAGTDSNISIAALTASMDSNAAKYISSISYQSSKLEAIQDLGDMVKEMLISFYKQNKAKPARILFYRGGVPEERFQEVLDQEVAAIRAACESLEKTYKPSLTFVTVQKSHHARFFSIKQEDSDGTGNCLPGTVIDTDIVHPYKFDFYLQSHRTIAGTARPARYTVLHDENAFSADVMQELTYRMCYLYGSSCSAISTVPAVYYANVVATRGRLYRFSDVPIDKGDIEAEKALYYSVHNDLKNTMYFI